MALAAQLPQTQAVQDLLNSLEAGQAGPQGGQPSAQEVLGGLQLGLDLGFSIFSNIYGMVTSINAQTGEVGTQSGIVPAANLGPVGITPPAGMGGNRADHVRLDIKDPGKEEEKEDIGDWIKEPANLALLLGGAFLLVLVVRR